MTSRPDIADNPFFLYIHLLLFQFAVLFLADWKKQFLTKQIAYG